MIASRIVSNISDFKVDVIKPEMFTEKFQT